MIPLVGWPAIAKAATQALGCSVSVRTAQRYARPGRPNRLPVYKYDNGRVYLKRSALKLWRQAWTMPLGGREPGRKEAGHGGAARASQHRALSRPGLDGA
jgi:hypothetical protein